MRESFGSWIPEWLDMFGTQESVKQQKKDELHRLFTDMHNPQYTEWEQKTMFETFQKALAEYHRLFARK